MVRKLYGVVFTVVFFIASGFSSNYAAIAQGELLHYWNFNHATDFLLPNVGAGSVVGTGTLISGNGQDFAGENARNSDPTGNHLRANLPIGTQINFSFSTEGHQDIVINYETRRSGSGAGTQKVSYTLNGTDYTPFTDVLPPDGAPDVFTLDFTAIEEADDNPGFGIRIEFEQSPGGAEGNNRFDNFTVEGTPIPAEVELLHYWNFNEVSFLEPNVGDGSLSGTGTLITGSAQEFAAENARNGDMAGNHLRANLPIGTQIDFDLTTEGYKNIVVKYETRRSGSGAGTQKISYTLNGTDYTPYMDVSPPDGAPVVFTFDFHIIEEINDNPDFGIRIEFEATGGGAEGNNRFDNFTVEGLSKDASIPVLTDPVILASPADDATNLALKPSLSWEPLASATNYDVQISAAEDFNSIAVEAHVPATTYNTALQLEVNTVYHWRVRGSNSSGDGPWSEVRSFTTTGSIAGSTLRVNEVMASNQAFVVDDDGDFSDWIEIYNSGDAPVDLTGYGLSDNVGDPYKWTFPAVTIDPHEFMLVWASSKNRTVPGSPLHTTYAISAGGETITITNNGGVTIDQYVAPSMDDDISWGRFPDGSGVFVLSTTPTPGEANLSGTAPLEATVTFSHHSGFYEAEFDLSLSTEEDGATIIYTLDGSTPDIANTAGTTYQYKIQYPYQPGDPVGDLLENSFQTLTFSDPIHVSDRSGKPNKISGITTTLNQAYIFNPPAGNKATVVKARIYKSGSALGPVTTHTYFSGDRSKYDYPVFSISTSEDLLFDYNNGMYVPGVDFDNWRAANPDEPSGAFTEANYLRDTEIPASVQFFEKSSTIAQINQNVEAKLSGGYSLSWPLKSLRLTATGTGEESYLNYKFYSDRSATNFKNIVLRNSGQDFSSTYFRDAGIQGAIKHLNVATQANRPAVVFLNGEYWGLITVRERLDEHYLERNYGINPNDVDLLEVREVDEGDAIRHNEMMNYADANDMSDDAAFTVLQGMMDIDNFIDYQISEIFSSNTDWPSNNYMVWRSRTPSSGNPYNDGRFRWMIKDTDTGWGLSTTAEHNTLAFATAVGGPAWPNPEWSTLLLRRCLENSTFQKQFISRFADLLNTTFQPSRLNALIGGMKQELVSGMPMHTARWNTPLSWDANVQTMVNFVTERQAHQREHLETQFALAGTHDLAVDVNNTERGYLHVNTIDILPSTPGVSPVPYPWTGKYFEGVPVVVKAVTYPGYKFVRWEGAELPANPVVTLNLESAVSIKAIFAIDHQHLPTIPIPVAPADVTTNLRVRPVFTWNAALNAETYTFELSTSAIFNDVVVNLSSIADAELVLEHPLEYLKTYYWRVRASNILGESDWSPVSSFTTLSAPPIVSSIANIGEPTALAWWSTVSDAVGYELHISTTDDFAETFRVIAIEITTTEATLTELPDNTYYVRVRAVYENDTGEWSDATTFDISVIQGIGEGIISEYSVSPNPVKDLLQLKVPHDFSIKSLHLIDGVGRSSELPVANEVDFSERPAGMFYLRITGTQGKSIILKVLKAQ